MSITKITVTNDDGTTADFVDASTIPAPVAPEVIDIPLDTPVELHAE